MKPTRLSVFRVSAETDIRDLRRFVSRHNPVSNRCVLLERGSSSAVAAVVRYENEIQVTTKAMEISRASSTLPYSDRRGPMSRASEVTPTRLTRELLHHARQRVFVPILDNGVIDIVFPECNDHASAVAATAALPLSVSLEGQRVIRLQDAERIASWASASHSAPGGAILSPYVPYPLVQPFETLTRDRARLAYSVLLARWVRSAKPSLGRVLDIAGGIGISSHQLLVEKAASRATVLHESAQHLGLHKVRNSDVAPAVQLSDGDLVQHALWADGQLLRADGEPLSEVAPPSFDSIIIAAPLVTPASAFHAYAEDDVLCVGSSRRVQLAESPADHPFLGDSATVSVSRTEELLQAASAYLRPGGHIIVLGTSFDGSTGLLTPFDAPTVASELPIEGMALNSAALCVANGGRSLWDVVSHQHMKWWPARNRFIGHFNHGAHTARYLTFPGVQPCTLADLLPKSDAQLPRNLPGNPMAQVAYEASPSQWVDPRTVAQAFPAIMDADDMLQNRAPVFPKGSFGSLVVPSMANASVSLLVLQKRLSVVKNYSTAQTSPSSSGSPTKGKAEAIKEESIVSKDLRKMRDLSALLSQWTSKLSREQKRQAFCSASKVNVPSSSLPQEADDYKALTEAEMLKKEAEHINRFKHLFLNQRNSCYECSRVFTTSAELLEHQREAHALSPDDPRVTRAMVSASGGSPFNRDFDMMRVPVDDSVCLQYQLGKCKWLRDFRWAQKQSSLSRIRSPTDTLASAMYVEDVSAGVACSKLHTMEFCAQCGAFDHTALACPELAAIINPSLTKYERDMSYLRSMTKPTAQARTARALGARWPAWTRMHGGGKYGGKSVVHNVLPAQEFRQFDPRMGSVHGPYTVMSHANSRFMQGHPGKSNAMHTLKNFSRPSVRRNPFGQTLADYEGV